MERGGVRTFTPWLILDPQNGRTLSLCTTGSECEALARRHRGRVAVLAPTRCSVARQTVAARSALSLSRLRGSYALDISINLAEEIAAVVTFYATYPGLDYHGAKAAYLCHEASEDPYVSAESAVEMQQALGAAGRQTTFYTYPGTRHWFFDANRVEAYDASAAALAWERTVAFLNAELRR